ncbi:MAG: head GIN domain-containing protein [Bacteroidota bacterium]
MNNTHRIFNALLIFSFMICLGACAQDDLGEVIVKEERNLPEFNKINVRTLGEINLKIGEERTIRIETHADIINDVSYEVVDKELVINYRSSRRNQNIRTLNITVTAEDYQKISLNEVSEIKVDDPINTANLEINQRDVGSIKLAEVNVDNLILNLNDVGNISIDNGTAKRGVLTLDGVGNIKTFGVTYETCKATLNDVGSIEVTVTESLDAEIRGVGNILYKGSPSVSKTERGTGKVTKR